MVPLAEQRRAELMTVPEVAEYFRVNEETVRRWIRAGELPVLNLGRKAGYRIRRNDLESFMERRYGPQSKAAA